MSERFGLAALYLVAIVAGILLAIRLYNAVAGS